MNCTYERLTVYKRPMQFQVRPNPDTGWGDGHEAPPLVKNYSEPLQGGEWESRLRAAAGAGAR